MNHLAILLISTLTFSGSSGCNSVQTESGECCYFPFMHGGQTYYECTSDGRCQEWCSLTYNYDQDGQWGNCGNCTTVQTEEGDCCYFPFVFNGQTYHQCTSDVLNQPWCSLTVNFNQDRRWGYCAGSSCGSRPAGTRIVGGTQAQKDSWPWMAMLVNANGTLLCGGSLIHEQWVLTAAQCVEGLSPSDIFVRMGAHKITDIAQELPVGQIMMHEHYDAFVLDNDIALLKLETQATLGAGVGRVCVPPDDSLSLDNITCYITGWGTTTEGESQPSTYLQEASVPTITNEQCQSLYDENGITVNITSSMLCAGQVGVGGVDACLLDGGGPLVCEFNGKWYLEGAASWGVGCGRPNFPGVYTRVRFHQDWIHDTMSSN